MKHIIAATAFAILSALALALPVKADERAEMERAITRVESYLSTLKTMQASFIQEDWQGGIRSGDFYLHRPGRLRFDYDPLEGSSQGDFIVADGTFIFYYDAALKQQSNTLIGQTLADFILREDVSFEEKLLVTNIENNDQSLALTLVQREDPAAGSLTLNFNRSPFQIVGWTVKDAQGLRTDIRLNDIETGMKLDRTLFFYHDPDYGRVEYNQ
tara:strand:- start:330 stop:971 length:642 start_codon:yes stop_codon:yes gene_type:complete